MNENEPPAGMSLSSRREFLRVGALGAGVLAAGMTRSESATPPAPLRATKTQPNVLFIISDQLGLDAIAAHGCPDVETPNLNRLVNRGVSFMLSHSTNPVCSPARSSLFTGRMPVETGVITNNRPIHEGIPNMGQWFRRAGYETVYCGKWHLPHGQPPAIDGFTVLPMRGKGDQGDPIIARTCEAYLKGRSRLRPFLLVASFLQPHDICYWAIRGKQLVPEHLPFPEIAPELPPLPPNHDSLPPAPARLAAAVYNGFSDEQWRYYLWIYYRQVEMVDREVGRVLEALEAAGLAETTLVVFTADHGEGRGRHMHVQKWYPYEEAAKVPLIVSCPGRLLENHRDQTHLVCGLDVMNTVCDYAGIAPPPGTHGRSLRPLLEGKPTQWREFLVLEAQIIGRAVRTPEFKYVHYENDPVEQLFDMRHDPWEMNNLYHDPKYAAVIKDHRRLLSEWNAGLHPVEPTTDYGTPVHRRRRS